MIGIYEINSSENLEFNANVFFLIFCSVQICWVEWVELGRVPTLLKSEVIYAFKFRKKKFLKYYFSKF
jgi:hypothetical protein